MRARGLRLIAAALALIGLLFAWPALAAFTPPPLSGHVVDTAGKLGPGEIQRLDAKLDAVRRQTGFAIVAFMVGSLEGETIEDVTYKTFNTWQIGEKGLDNGVLLVIAPAERKVRIETGKGVGGALTDLQSNDIIRQRIIPLLQQERFGDAVEQGTDAIAETLVSGTPGGGTAGKQAPPRTPDGVKIGIGAGVIVLVVVLAIFSPGFRSILWLLLHALLWSRLGGGGRGGGGSGYSGGGGRSGGGGSSDSY
jgi:uncharacterized protein